MSGDETWIEERVLISVFFDVVLPNLWCQQPRPERRSPDRHYCCNGNQGRY